MQQSKTRNPFIALLNSSFSVFEIAKAKFPVVFCTALCYYIWTKFLVLTQGNTLQSNWNWNSFLDSWKWNQNLCHGYLLRWLYRTSELSCSQSVLSAHPDKWAPCEGSIWTSHISTSSYNKENWHYFIWGIVLLFVKAATFHRMQKLAVVPGIFCSQGDVVHCGMPFLEPGGCIDKIWWNTAQTIRWECEEEQQNPSVATLCTSEPF